MTVPLTTLSRLRVGVVLVGALSVLQPLSASSASARGNAPSWSTYHGDSLGQGVIPAASVSLHSPRWVSPPLDGDLYGQPVADGNRILVATENNTFYALSASSGRILWRRHVAQAVPASDLACGDIAPTVGITGTPVVDLARHEVFAVAFEKRGPRDLHVLVGVSTLSGAVEASYPVDPAGVDPRYLLQRTGLSLDQGHVIFGFGGNSGDCGPYRGRVVSVSENGESTTFFTIDAAAGQREGAVWMGGGAPVIDGRGNIWVESGNGSVTSTSAPYDRSDAVLELSPSLHLLQYFAPNDWTSQNAADLDLSASPIVTRSGAVLAVGKAGTAYLLSASHLGGIGGDLTHLSACPGTMDGGSAVVNTVAYLPCMGGVVAVQFSFHPARLRELWSSGQGGSSPVVTSAQVLSLSGDGTLVALSRTTGHLEESYRLPGLANHFPTVGYAANELLVDATRTVYAFSTH